MFSFPLAFILLVVPKFMFLELHLFNFCFKFHGSFYIFWNIEKISTVKLSEKFQKNKNKNFQVKCELEAPGVDQGVHPWPRRSDGVAQPLAAPHRRLGPTGTSGWPLFFLSLSLFLLKSSCSCSGFAFLLCLDPKL